MKFLRYLQEEYFGSLPDKVYKAGVAKNISIEILRNPSIADMKKISKFHSRIGGGDSYLRFLIDTKKKDLYIWTANSQILHDDVSKHFKLKYDLKGYGDLSSKGKLRIDDIHWRGLLDSYPWLTKYFEMIY